VIPYDMQAPVAVRCLWTNCYTLPLPLPLPLFTGDYDEVFMTKSLNVIRRQQSLTSNKREAQVSSNQRQSSRYYVTDEANY